MSGGIEYTTRVELSSPSYVYPQQSEKPPLGLVYDSDSSSGMGDAGRGRRGGSRGGRGGTTNTGRSHNQSTSNSPPTPQESAAHYGGPYDPRFSQHGPQYTMSGAMGMPMAPTPPPYAHYPSNNFIQDSNPILQNLHPSFAQPRMYTPFQRHSPDLGPAYTSQGPSNYSLRGVEQPLAPSTPLSTPSSSYPQGQPHFFPQGYNYVPQYAPAPSYQPQHYTPAGYTQKYAQPASQEAPHESLGTWVYLPHNMHQQRTQYDGSVQQCYQQPQPQFGTPYELSRRELEPVYIHTPGPSTSAHSVSKPSTASGASSPPNSIMSPSSSSLGGPKKNGVRRSYHPNPPAHRSEFVMWSGNVPSDSTHDELWKFFNQPAVSSPSSEDRPDPQGGGVVSIFLISRSSCAFVNFDSEASLNQAIERFNGRALRDKDPRCPRLVCRVRRKEDDLKAGVGAQRGMGIHKRWIRDQGLNEKDECASSGFSPASSAADSLSSSLVSLSLSSDEDSRHSRGPQPHASSGSGSTTSSVLTRYFPIRYFILKSLTQFDLDLSVEKGLWATQPHNEGILDQAYRTSKEVYLIFSVNGSGEFFGIARMAGPLRHGEHQVSWAARAGETSPSSRTSLSPTSGRITSSTMTGSPLAAKTNSRFLPTPETKLVDSPLPLSAANPAPPELRHGNSAPAILGPKPRILTMEKPHSMRSLDTRAILTSKSIPLAHEEGQDDFLLDEQAPIRAARHPELLDPEPSVLLPVAEEEEKSDVSTPAKVGEPNGRPEGWGESFRVDWIFKERLPFYRTRNIRNPWNNDREIKVSRDGTELEPSIGRLLIEEWEQFLSEPQPVPATPQTKGTATGRRPTMPKAASALPAVASSNRL